MIGSHKQTVEITMLDDNRVRLDFGEEGSIDVSPEKALAFVCDQKIRDRIRVEALRARKNAVELGKKIAAERNGGYIHSLPEGLAK